MDAGFRSWTPPLAPLITDAPRCSSPEPMPPAHGARRSLDDARPVPTIIHTLPSPASALSSGSCGSLDDDNGTASSYSSLSTPSLDGVLGPSCCGGAEGMFFGGPHVQEPEDGCLSQAAGMKRSVSLTRQREVTKEAFGMLWRDPVGDKVRSLSS